MEIHGELSMKLFTKIKLRFNSASVVSPCEKLLKK
jgi:hypothetical protein